MSGELMTEIAHIPEDVRHELRADETPQWIGYPNPKRYAIQEGLGRCLFAILYTAFAVFWVSKVMQSASPHNSLFVIPFILVGLYLLANPLLEYWRALRTIYVVTNQRVLILNGVLRPSKKVFAPSNLGDFDVERKHDGSGNIILSEEQKRAGEQGVYTVKIGFKAISNVREAEEHIEALQDQS